MLSTNNFSDGTALVLDKEEVIFTVNLKKKSRERLRSSIGNLSAYKSLASRTFQLKGSTLSYYVDQACNEKKGDINISGAVVSKSSSSRFRSNVFGFEIVTEDNETVYLEASSADVRDQCIQQLSAAALLPFMGAGYDASHRSSAIEG